MSVLGTVLVVVIYVLIGLVEARLLAGHIAYTFLNNENKNYYRAPKNSPNGEQWFGAWCIALLTVPIWPTVVVISQVSFEKRAVGAEARALAKRREEKIKQLEQELNIS